MVAELFATRAVRSRIRDTRAVYDALHQTWNTQSLWKTTGGHHQFSASKVALKIVGVVRDVRDNKNIAVTLPAFYSAVEEQVGQYSWEELFTQALLLAFHVRRLTGLEVTPEVAFRFVLKKVVDETIEGFMGEREGLTMFQTLFPETKWRFASPLEDRQDGVDIVGIDPSGLVIGAQIKPPSYVNGYRTNSKIFANRCKEHKRHEAFVQKHERACVQVWYRDPIEGWLYLKAEDMPCVKCGKTPKSLTD
jgi:hypothetical protein